MTLEYGAQTDKGKVRTNNEDSILADGKSNIFIVADGMGGHNSGEVASRMACEIISKNLEAAMARTIQADRTQILYGENDPALSVIANHAVSSIRLANQVIYEASLGYSQNKGMGTTLVLTLYHNNSYIIGWVGDSRAYLIRHGGLQQLTNDHSVVQEQIDKGLITPKQAEASEYKNILTRALGTDTNVKPDVVETPAFPDDYVLLCTDGLTKMLTDAQIMEAFKGGASPQEIALELITKANSAGGRDNISSIVLHVSGGSVWDKLISSIRKL